MKIPVMILVEVENVDDAAEFEAGRVAAVAAVRDHLAAGVLTHGERGRNALATHGMAATFGRLRAVEVSGGGVCWPIEAAPDWATDPRTAPGQRVSIRTREGQTFAGDIWGRDPYRNELSVETRNGRHYVAFSDIRELTTG